MPARSHLHRRDHVADEQHLPLQHCAAAHKTALHPRVNPLPPMSRAAVITALDAIADFLDTFQRPFTDAEMGYRWTFLGPGDGDALVYSLREAREHCRLQREGNVPLLPVHEQ